MESGTLLFTQTGPHSTLRANTYLAQDGEYITEWTTQITALGNYVDQYKLNPNTDSFVSSDKIINTTVGYHISDEDRKKIVTTDGGGGDDVSYSPYKDTESILFTVLSNKFEDVYLVKNLDDNAFIKENEIKLIFIPEIITQSSSSSAFTCCKT